MPITDYKVTDVERDAVYVQAQSDVLSGTAAQNKAVFDAYPELIRDNLDGLCDYVSSFTFSHTVTASASTNAKTPEITTFVPLGAIVDLIFTSGNTASSPTIAIDGVTHNISGLPTVAKLTDSGSQTYKVKRTGETTLTFLDKPDYVCERGAVGTLSGGWYYERMAGGNAKCWCNHNIGSVTLSASSITIETTNKLYYDNVIIGHDYPFEFVAVKYSSTTHKTNTTGAVWIAGSNANEGTTTTPPGVILGRYATSAPTIDGVTLCNLTIGTWK